MRDAKSIEAYLAEGFSLTCPYACDKLCTAVCHESHQPAWKRDHEPEECPAVTGKPL